MRANGMDPFEQPANLDTFLAAPTHSALHALLRACVHLVLRDLGPCLLRGLCLPHDKPKRDRQRLRCRQRMARSSSADAAQAAASARPTSAACEQVQALEVSRATLEAQGAKGVALAERFNAAKKKLTAAKKEAAKAAHSLSEGERKRDTLRDTLTALEARLAASNEVRASLCWAV
jgi:hypothetical protein